MKLINVKLKNQIVNFKYNLKLMFKEFFNRKTCKKQIANMITFLRLIIPILTTLLITIFLLTNSTNLILISTILIGIGGVSDAIDGFIARKLKTVSDFGKQLDQVADKWFTGILAINLSMLNPAFIYLIIGEAAIFGANLVGKLKISNSKCNSSKIGKIKQWPLFATLCSGMISQYNISFSLITKILGASTIILQTMATVDYINKNNRELLEQNKEKFDNNHEIKISTELGQYENNKKIENNNKENIVNLKKEKLRIYKQVLMEGKEGKNSIDEQTQEKGNQYKKKI